MAGALKTMQKRCSNVGEGGVENESDVMRFSSMGSHGPGLLVSEIIFSR